MLPKAALARAYGIMGDRENARKAVQTMEELTRRRFISEYDFAVANSGWNREDTLRWLEKADKGRTGLLIYARVDSVFDDLRSDPRFQSLVTRVGIPQ